MNGLGKIVIIFILILALSCILFNYLNHTYIKAEFKKMDPMPAKMGVYYKGYKLGTTTKLKISKDFKTTYLYIKLNQNGLHLPKNISAKIKNYNKDIKYVDIIYPPAPMIKYIKTGDIIQGESSFTISGISDINQAHLDDLSEKGSSLLSSATKTTDALTELFSLVTDILNENRKNIYDSTTHLNKGMANLEKSTQNLKNMTQKIDNGITEQNIKNSSSNIEEMTSNFANSSKNFISITGNFNKSSSDFSVLVPKLSTLIDGVQLVICNINDIVTGVKKTLQQRMGGARIIFGKPMK